MVSGIERKKKRAVESFLRKLQNFLREEVKCRELREEERIAKCFGFCLAW